MSRFAFAKVNEQGDKDMNEHLRPVFEKILPAIEQTGINYWVYGGIGVAACYGDFFRDKGNQDVDIFLVDNDFKDAKSILGKLCQKYGFELKCYDQERPKVEITIDSHERFSMIPVYKECDNILFRYSDGDQRYSDKILRKLERNISGFKFFTPTDDFIRQMFISHIKARPDKIKRKKIIDDARHIFSEQEFKKYFARESYEKT